jgi:hypothetical protein
MQSGLVIEYVKPFLPCVTSEIAFMYNAEAQKYVPHTYTAHGLLEVGSIRHTTIVKFSCMYDFMKEYIYKNVSDVIV